MKVHLGNTLWKEEYTYETDNKIKVTKYSGKEKEVKIIEN